MNRGTYMLCAQQIIFASTGQNCQQTTVKKKTNENLQIVVSV